MAEVFLMEDSAPLRRVLVEELREAGHNVTAFPDGSEAGDTLFLGAADVLVTDLMMPKVSGLEVIDTVRESYPDLPIIVITGKPVEALKALPVSMVMQKPLTSRDLLDQIDAVGKVA